jgi:hypothetical protein
MPNGELGSLGTFTLKKFLEEKVKECEGYREVSENNGYENYDYYDGLVDGYSIALNKLVELERRH